VSKELNSDQEVENITILNVNLRRSPRLKNNKPGSFERFFELEDELIVDENNLVEENRGGINILLNNIGLDQINNSMDWFNDRWVTEALNMRFEVQQEIDLDLELNVTQETNDGESYDTSMLWNELDELAVNGNQSGVELDMTNNSTDGDIKVNEKNKVMLPCHICNLWFEAAHGLLRHFNAKHKIELINNSIGQGGEGCD
jgi:hypothetical protein